MRAIIDENVRLAVARAMREHGWKVEHMAETAERAIADAEVWEKTRVAGALLITPDHHLTNPVRLPPSEVAGIRGNLSASQEVALVVGFLARHDPESLRGRLVTLSPTHLSIR
jgi:predicted nuclease of predicted toxin-antitoxin system